jgi:pimeloyl-ACP methyl ester carboxylesterase
MPDDDPSDTPESLAARQADEAHRARYPVEAAYTKPGPYATTTGTVTDGAGNAIYDLYYPEDYAALGFKSPIVTWGNGTWGIPPYYSTLLGHLASFGFSVIGTTSRETGSGVEIGDAAHYLVTQAGTAGSVFYGNLDVTRVAAAGHSQGAAGATLAALNNPALIKTLMTFSLPITYWLNGPSIAQLSRPAFLTSTHGIFDSVIAPPMIERIFFETLTVPAALGIILDSDGKRADHASIEDIAYGGNPGGELGYATAWLAYQLRSDPTAAAAFTGAHPELVSNSNWPGSAVK